jgi:hypothetical protein
MRSWLILLMAAGCESPFWPARLTSGPPRESLALEVSTDDGDLSEISPLAYSLTLAGDPRCEGLLLSPPKGVDLGRVFVSGAGEGDLLISVGASGTVDGRWRNHRSTVLRVRPDGSRVWEVAVEPDGVSLQRDGGGALWTTSRSVTALDEAGATRLRLRLPDHLGATSLIRASPSSGGLLVVADFSRVQSTLEIAGVTEEGTVVQSMLLGDGDMGLASISTARDGRILVDAAWGHPYYAYNKWLGLVERVEPRGQSWAVIDTEGVLQHRYRGPVVGLDAVYDAGRQRVLADDWVATWADGTISRRDVATDEEVWRHPVNTYSRTQLVPTTDGTLLAALSPSNVEGEWLSMTAVSADGVVAPTVTFRLSPLQGDVEAGRDFNVVSSERSLWLSVSDDTGVRIHNRELNGGSRCQTVGVDADADEGARD